MITNITDKIFTAAYYDIDSSDPRIDIILDVRHLVDKQGNSKYSMLEQIDAAEAIYKTKGEVIIACDAGISRSRVVAIGLLTRLGWNYNDAINHVRKISDKPEINLPLLNSLKQCISLPESVGPSVKPGGIVLLGGSGFVGRHIAEALSTTRRVIAPTSSQINLLTDGIELDELVEKHHPDTMIFSIHPKSYHTTSAFSQSLAILKNALNIARERNLKFIYISSLVVFSGNARFSDEYIYEAKEGDKPIPWGTYAESKYLGEELVRLYADLYDVRSLIVRASGLYGSGMNPMWLIPKLFRLALAGDEMITHEYSNGLPIFELLHVEDFARAIDVIADEKIWPSLMHVGSATSISTKDLAQLIAALTHSSSKCVLLKIHDKLTNVISVDGGYINRLNWSPKISLTDGLQSILEKEHA